MADIEVTRAHGKSVAEARKIAEQLIGQLSKEFEFKHRWEGDTLKFERSGVNGQLAITPKDLQISAKLGLLLKPLKGRIEKEIQATLDKQLA